MRAWCLGALVACTHVRGADVPATEIVVAPADGGTRAMVVDLGAPPSPSGPSDLQRMLGQWGGVGRQDDGQSWPLEIEIVGVGPGLCATAFYPTLPCRAEWICAAPAGDVLVAQEKLLGDSAQRCVDNGTMKIRLASDRGSLEWSWEGAGQTAEARFHRRMR